MLTSVEIAWVAGLLEGEAWFGNSTSGCPIIHLVSTDYDVIEMFRRVTKTTHKKVTTKVHDKHKTQYSTRISSNEAIQWMMTIYCLMSLRRKDKIRNVLNKWKEHNLLRVKRGPQEQKRTNKYYEMIKIIMATKKVSREEAMRMYENFLNSAETIQ